MTSTFHCYRDKNIFISIMGFLAFIIVILLTSVNCSSYKWWGRWGYRWKNSCKSSSILRVREEDEKKERKEPKKVCKFIFIYIDIFVWYKKKPGLFSFVKLTNELNLIQSSSLNNSKEARCKSKGHWDDEDDNDDYLLLLLSLLIHLTVSKCFWVFHLHLMVCFVFICSLSFQWTLRL